MRDMPMGCFSELTPAQLERLAILAEECAEVIQIIMKIQRHGYASHHPNDAELEWSNRDLLAKEIGHVRTAINMLADARDISDDMILKCTNEKEKNIKPYLYHQ
jgi:hypothetical protein